MAIKEYAVSIEIQGQLAERVSNFNKKKLADNPCKYCIDARGKFVYLLRAKSDGSFEKIGRLTYDGDLENMDFAIFRYSIEKYDAACDYFDGIEYIDGTIEGAMLAGLEAYPIDDTEIDIALVNYFLPFFSKIKKRKKLKKKMR